MGCNQSSDQMEMQEAEIRQERQIERMEQRQEIRQEVRQEQVMVAEQQVAMEVAAPAVVMEQPMAPWPPVEVIPEADFGEEVVLDFSPPEVFCRPGTLKMKLNRAHIRYHEGPEFERMSPFVKVNIGMDFEWKSAVKEGEGKDPSWGEFAHFEVRCFDGGMTDAMMRIEIKDHQGLMDNSPLGYIDVPVHYFARCPGECRQTWLQVGFGDDAIPSGRVHFHSTFFEDAAEAIVDEFVAPREEVVVVEEPVAVVEEPVAVIEEPVAVIEEPVAVVEEPVVAVEEEVAVQEEVAAVEEEVAVQEEVAAVEEEVAVQEEVAVAEEVAIEESAPVQEEVALEEEVAVEEQVAVQEEIAAEEAEAEVALEEAVADDL